jgi:hypothetical protein
MQRLTVLLACSLVLTATACGSSSSKATAPPNGTTSPSTTSANVAVTTTTSAPAALPDACTFATTADVTALLGAVPPTPGTPTKYEATYVTCDWSAKPPGASNENSFRLAVVEKKTPDQQGFSVPTDLPDSCPVAGLGDKATIYSRAGTFSGVTLIAEKGQFAIALTGQYGGNAPAQSALEADMVALARKVFAAVGA